MESEQFGEGGRRKCKFTCDPGQFEMPVNTLKWSIKEQGQV